MHYIVFDLEFNQDFSSSHSFSKEKKQCPFEIIQIGAVKLDQYFNTITTFNRYVKPTLYSVVKPYITDLTGITTEQLLSEKPFPQVFNDYVDFIGKEDSVLCVWGMADIKELFRNVEFHKLDKQCLSESFINLQPYVSAHFGFSKAKQVGLQSAVEALQISMPYPFHSALHDAYYTAEILKKIQNPEIQPKRYDPHYVAIRPVRPKKNIDFEKLLQQFEKMYDRELSKEEQDMIILAYKMGKTHQFLK
ncbi:3'-5' exonuclease [Clostridium aminobutyricum]|uniref:Exonuclease domain-containing protein n=1 Tax=Clostridium aminobutyricum TaxID=33953 RepID=A0A939D5Q6_CLOAM|nr:3'-5' exonuclease [Clostridium aminobutyricum]MBN7771774.1 exonuclease domain-containing protein [Clostridium aminobutyricum]